MSKNINKILLSECEGILKEIEDKETAPYIRYDLVTIIDTYRSILRRLNIMPVEMEERILKVTEKFKQEVAKGGNEDEN